MLALEAAVAQVMSEASPLPAEPIALADALGRVLAEPVRSPVALPPWDNAGMDGYAVRAADIQRASSANPVTLRVTGIVAAGDLPVKNVERGEASRIMTGAPVPAGADSVVRIEDTDGGEQMVVVHQARDALRNVRRRGEDLSEGAVAIDSGTLLAGAQIGLLASVGAATLRVHRRPRVAIISSGNELVPIEDFGEVRAGRRIVSSNGYALSALVLEAGGDPLDLGIVHDDPAALRARVGEAAGCDLLITSGGASVGAHDYTKQIISEIGELRFWRVRIRPGAQLAFGVLDGKPWLALPGNPVSALVVFELFVRPMLNRMQGLTRIYRRPVPAVLDDRVETNAPLTHLLRAVLTVDSAGAYRARLTGEQGSGMLSSMARADALLVIGEEQRLLEPGSTVPALLLGGGSQHSANWPL